MADETVARSQGARRQAAPQGARRHGPLEVLAVGEGPPLVVLHGFAMRPDTYLPLARVLAARSRVVIPSIFAVPSRWTFGQVLDDLEATVDSLGLDRFSLLGHSFGGGLELGFAARHPHRVVELVFSDTLAVRDRFSLAEEALHNPLGVLAMATPPATRAFVHSLVTHPVQLARAALWGFATDRQPDIDRVVAAGIPCHVLWANRDSLISRDDGRAFARALRASFTIASDRTVDHDWMFDDPELFAEHLGELGLRALGGDRPGAVASGSDRQVVP